MVVAQTRQASPQAVARILEGAWNKPDYQETLTMFNRTLWNPRKARAVVAMIATATATRQLTMGALLALVVLSTSGTTYPERQEYQCRIFVDWLELDLFFHDHYHSHSSHNPEELEPRGEWMYWDHLWAFGVSHGLKPQWTIESGEHAECDPFG